MQRRDTSRCRSGARRSHGRPTAGGTRAWQEVLTRARTIWSESSMFLPGPGPDCHMSTVERSARAYLNQFGNCPNRYDFLEGKPGLTNTKPHSVIQEQGRHAGRCVPIAVIGMHRSGTSLATRILNLAGMYLGEESDLM